MKYFSFIFVLCTLLSCTQTKTEIEKETTPIKSVKIYLRYLAANQETQAEVRFFSDSGNIALLHPVQFNGHPMQIRKLPKVGHKYFYQKKGTMLEKDYSFAFVDSEGKEQIINYVTPSCSGLKLEGGSLSKSSGGQLSWNGDAFVAEANKTDMLRILISDSSGKTYTFNRPGSSTKNGFRLNPQLLGQLALGAGKLSVVREHSYRQKSAFAQELTLAHYLNEFDIQINP